MLWITLVFVLFLASFTAANENGKLKIILVGLPKCGTTSFHQFLQKLDFKSAHFRASGFKIVSDLILKAKSEKLPMLHYLGDFDAITEMARVGKPLYDKSCYFPQAEDLETLYEENKDALFILNSREVEKHARSMEMFPYYGRLLQRLCPDYLPGNSSMKVNERYQLFIRTHNQHVRDFFASKPEAKYLEFKIEDGDLSLFKPYFDTRGEKFPHAYKSPQIA